MSATFKLHLGDCIATMRTLPEASVDAIVTDPPYELGFMGKAWDASGIANSVEMWREALRVLKPGGHLLAFSGSRTYHRMVCAIEDAGFDIRDQIMWIYGSGFPKSLDVSKAIDKAAGAEREVIGKHANPAGNKAGGNSLNMSAVGMPEEAFITTPATDAARQWQGWGTALKPAHEPIVVARKPLIGTVAANVLAHGTGALNIDKCRVDADGCPVISEAEADYVATTGRWPANLIHDGSEEVLAAFPQAPGQMAAASTSDTPRAGQNTYGAMRKGRGAEPSADSENEGAVGFKMKPGARRLDAGSAARFFYAAKASKADRNAGLDDFAARSEPAHRRTNIEATGDNPYLRGVTERLNTHPTVKPTDLMAYLVRLVTPPGGTVLDPFTGSGSTGKACMREGFSFIGCELSPEYLAIATARIEYEQLLAAQRAYEALLKGA